MAHWVPYNANPAGNRNIDCTVRAISVALGQSWHQTYAELFVKGFIAKMMPETNVVWRNYLRRKGFGRATIPDTCPDCYTVGDFADEHPTGVYVLGTGDHAVAVVSGNVIDTFDSRGMPALYYYYRKEDTPHE